MPMGELHGYRCGQTSHQLAALLRGAARERRIFPSSAFLYTAGTRRVLFDTGYALPPWRAGLASALYRRLLPPVITAPESIHAQIDASSVTHVVLSHLHPDHIGGVRHFPSATVVVSAALLESVQRARLRDGIFARLLPEWFPGPGAVVIDEFSPGPFGLGGHDLFGDGSYVILDLPGHAAGHLGALVEHGVILAGDAAWGRDFLGQEHRMKPLPRWISHDPETAAATAGALREAEAAGIRLVFSHDPPPSRIELRGKR